MPLVAINAASSDEKSSPRKGHPATIHLWWARRPLAACRSVLFAQLVDDPSSVPEEFETETEQIKERARLHLLMGELAKWERSLDEGLLTEARREISRSIARWHRDRGKASDEDHKMLRGLLPDAQIASYLAAAAPAIHDPFCGGGTIPLEAQRLGLPSVGSDLNPVAVLITKALIEIAPRFAGASAVNPEAKTYLLAGGQSCLQGFTADIRHYGEWIRNEAEKRIGHLYPKVMITEDQAIKRPDLRPYIGQERPVIAWLWARTTVCPNPTCGVAMPLIKSFWLCRKKGKETWIEPLISEKSLDFHVTRGAGQPQRGLVERTGARCLCCDSPIRLDQIRSEGQAGNLGYRLIATIAEGHNERLYLDPTRGQERLAAQALALDAPETWLPDKALSFRVQSYGIVRHRDLFTPRQLLALTTLSDLLKEARRLILCDAKNAGMLDDNLPLENGGSGARAYAEAVSVFLAFAVDKTADYSSTLCGWISSSESVQHTFTRHSLPMVWDFAEINIFSKSVGNFANHVEWIARGIQELPSSTPPATVEHRSATDPMPSHRKVVFCTDPPYYDNIGYADLSDFFYIWLRRSLGDVFPALMGTVLTPKEKELIATPYRSHGPHPNATTFFEAGLHLAFEQMKHHQLDGLPLTLFYAFKQAEDDEEHELAASTGWETMLSGLLKAGLTIEATWPIRTERTARTIGIGTNALASSIVLACRPRKQGASRVTRSTFGSTLKADLKEAVKKLQQSGIAPVDLAQSAIGPGMAAFSRYDAVLEANGSSMSVRSALVLIDQILDEILSDEEADYDSDTRWAITWFTQYGFDPAPYGEAEILSKARTTSVQGLERAGIVKARAGKVRLLRREELAIWHPATDDRFTVWEACQHLIKTLETEGEAAAAHLLQQLGSRSGAARDLAYRLYQHCDRKGDAEEARAYNGLVVAWPRLATLAAEEPRPVTPTLDFS